MQHHAIIGFILIALLSGCVAVGGNTTVTGAGPDEMLKLRAGPGLGFDILLGLPDGTRLVRQGCVTEMGQSWCRVALADAPGITGYVAEDYLSAR